jgi:hypothetical protein
LLDLVSDQVRHARERLSDTERPVTREQFVTELIETWGLNHRLDVLTDTALPIVTPELNHQRLLDAALARHDLLTAHRDELVAALPTPEAQARAVLADYDRAVRDALGGGPDDTGTSPPTGDDSGPTTGGWLGGGTAVVVVLAAGSLVVGDPTAHSAAASPLPSDSGAVASGWGMGDWLAGSPVLALVGLGVLGYLIWRRGPPGRRWASLANVHTRLRDSVSRHRRFMRRDDAGEIDFAELSCGLWKAAKAAWSGVAREAGRARPGKPTRQRKNINRYFIAQIISDLSRQISVLALPIIAIAHFNASPVQVGLLTSLGATAPRASPAKSPRRSWGRRR